MVTMVIEGGAATMGRLVGRSPAVQKLLLLAGICAMYAGGVGFMLMVSRGLAAL